MCSGEVANQLLYNFAGGLSELIASVGLVLTGLLLLKKSGPVSDRLAFAVDIVMKIVAEGFLTEMYSPGVFDILITAIQLASLFGFVIYFAEKERHGLKVAKTS